ncbi:ribosomal protein s18 domain-containing protein [Ditylenchus destructor]|nr:ribosomal protein s18 domain-containing protein [Ditylenchus destructor]
MLKRFLKAPLVSTLLRQNRFYASAPVCEDDPVDLGYNPFEKDARQCVLCRHKVKLDYKNSRLLQQFVSNFSGRVYERHLSGLCEAQHQKVCRIIALSRKAGYMPILVKDPKYMRDPRLFDPMKPLKPHSYA